MKFCSPFSCMAAALLFAASCSPPPEEKPTPTPTSTPIPTPHPAQAANEAAVQLYPDLGKRGSTFSRVFLDYYAARQKSDPASLTSPDWPLELARHTASVLGVSPYSPTPNPTDAQRRTTTIAPEQRPSQPNWFQQRLQEKPALDKGAYDQRGFPPYGNYYYDSFGRRYWIDPYGRRHYIPRSYYSDPWGGRYWIDEYGAWHYE